MNIGIDNPFTKKYTLKNTQATLKVFNKVFFHQCTVQIRTDVASIKQWSVYIQIQLWESKRATDNNVYKK
jgi:hypothetical protein